MKKYAAVVLLFIFLLALTACGGGGGDDASGTVVAGVASKGPIKGGAVKIYALNADGSKGSLLAEAVTDNNGAYRAGLGSYQGALLLEASGSYTDEASGAASTVPADAPLRAAIANASGEVSLAVTPLTELAVQMGADPITGRLTVADLASNNALIAALFKVDILGTMPIDPLTANASASSEQKLHALVLGAISQMMQREGKNLQQVLAELRGAIGADGKIAIPVAVQFQASLADFARSPANRTGIEEISATPLINIGGTTRALTITVSGAPSQIAGVDAVVILPPGVTVKAGSDGVLPGTVLQLAGAASENGIVAGAYLPPSGSMRGRVRLAVLSAQGFAPGELVTLQCDLAPDAAPADADVVLSLLSAIDPQGASLPGLSISAQFRAGIN